MHSSTNVDEVKQAVATYRTTYEKIFRDQERKDAALPKEQGYDARGWTIPFRASGKVFVDCLGAAAAAAASSSSYELSLNGKATQVFPSDQEVILVGRRAECDVVTAQAGTSRLHAMLYLLPAQNKVVLVDAASLMGVQTLARGDP